MLCLLLSLSSVYAITDYENSESISEHNTPSVRYWNSKEVIANMRQSALETVRLGIVITREDPTIVPVLYHNIVFGRTGNMYNRDIYNFELDLLFLMKNYHIISFHDLYDLSTGQNKLTGDATIISFDDGDLSMYAIVYPLLKELGIKATFFIVPNYVGTVGYMNWDQMREMAQYRTPEGKRLFFFESHSLRHSRLGELSEEDVRYELSESKRIIEEELGDTVTVIALPFGSGAQEDHVMLAALKSGYNMIRTSTPGAINPNKLNLMNIRTFNVENYSNDVFVRNMLRITGR